MATNFIEFAALFASSLLLNLAADAQLTILGGPATGSAGGGAAGPLSAALLNLAGLPLNDPCKKYLDNANGTGYEKKLKKKWHNIFSLPKICKFSPIGGISRLNLFERKNSIFSIS